jgi:hypothetical protein
MDSAEIAHTLNVKLWDSVVVVVRFQVSGTARTHKLKPRGAGRFES